MRSPRRLNIGCRKGNCKGNESTLRKLKQLRKTYSTTHRQNRVIYDSVKISLQLWGARIAKVRATFLLTTCPAALIQTAKASATNWSRLLTQVRHSCNSAFTYVMLQTGYMCIKYPEFNLGRYVPNSYTITFHAELSRHFPAPSPPKS